MRVIDRLFPDIADVPRKWKDRHWGINGSADYGEPAYPGWKRPSLICVPTITIMAIWIAGWLAIPLFFLTALAKGC